MKADNKDSEAPVSREKRRVMLNKAENNQPREVSPRSTRSEVNGKRKQLVRSTVL